MHPDRPRPRLAFSQLDADKLVNVAAGQLYALSVGDDGLVLTVWLTCNVEQALHHVDVDEDANQVRVTAWYG